MSLFHELALLVEVESAGVADRLTRRVAPPERRYLDSAVGAHPVCHAVSLEKPRRIKIIINQ